MDVKTVYIVTLRFTPVFQNESARQGLIRSKYATVVATQQNLSNAQTCNYFHRLNSIIKKK